MPTRVLESVLLVDDDAYTCDIFQLVLQHHEVGLVVVDNAESALDYLQHHHPDVIVLDIFMPGTDGPQALALIRRGGLAPDSRVVATTAFYTQETPKDVKDWGFDGYLPKPLSSGDLVPRLRRILEGSFD